MTCVLHLSDTHFGTEDAAVVEAVRQCCVRVAPDLVLLGGDITQRAWRRQFDAARRFVASLGRPVLAVPGNHDIPLFNLAARFLHPYGAYRRALGRALEPAFDEAGLLVLGVNTTRPFLRVDGCVSDDQIHRVARRLSQARPGQLRMVLLHHPVRAIEASDRGNLLRRHEAAVSAWVAAGVDLVLGGHIHLPYVLPLFPEGQGFHGWAVQAGTAVSRRVRGGIPNSVNVIQHRCAVGAHQCDITRWDYDGSRFVPALTTTLHWRR